MITFDPRTFVVLGLIAAGWAYRIHTKRGSDSARFAFAVVLAALLFGIAIYVGPSQPS